MAIEKLLSIDNINNYLLDDKIFKDEIPKIIKECQLDNLKIRWNTWRILLNILPCEKNQNAEKS